MITNQKTSSPSEIIFRGRLPRVAMVAMVATSQKSSKCASSLPFEVAAIGWESRAPFSAAPARRPRALAAGLGRFSCHGHHGHHGHP